MGLKAAGLCAFHIFADGVQPACIHVVLDQRVILHEATQSIPVEGLVDDRVEVSTG